MRTDIPTRPTVFFREGSFYVVNTYEDEGFAELAEHAALNPGTLRIEDVHGNVLWRPQLTIVPTPPSARLGEGLSVSQEEPESPPERQGTNPGRGT